MSNAINKVKSNVINRVMCNIVSKMKTEKVIFKYKENGIFESITISLSRYQDRLITEIIKIYLNNSHSLWWSTFNYICNYLNFAFARSN